MHALCMFRLIAVLQAHLDSKLLQVQKWANCTESQMPSYRQFKCLVDDPECSLPECYTRGSLPQLQRFWTTMISNRWLLWASTYDLDWAFHVFHSLNSRGVPLSDVNKLKAHVLNQWSSETYQIKQRDASMAAVGGENMFEQVLRYMAIVNGMENRVAFLDYMVWL